MEIKDIKQECEAIVTEINKHNKGKASIAKEVFNELLVKLYDRQKQQVDPWRI